jgi:hypothetical protein
MFMLGLEMVLFEPLFPLVGLFVAIQLEFTPFDAAVLHVDVTVVLMLFQFTAKFLESLRDGVGVFHIRDMFRLPFSQLVPDDLISKSECGDDRQQKREQHSSQHSIHLTESRSGSLDYEMESGASRLFAPNYSAFEIVPLYLAALFGFGADVGQDLSWQFAASDPH